MNLERTRWPVEDPLFSICQQHTSICSETDAQFETGVFFKTHDFYSQMIYYYYYCYCLPIIKVWANMEVE